MVKEILKNEVRLGSGKGEPATLAKWLEKRCKDEKLSYRQAASKAHISHATVATIRKGTRPSAATIVKLAEAFGNNGKNQRSALEDYLLTLCGYRSGNQAAKSTEPLARLLDRLSHFDEEKLKLVEAFVDFSATLGNGDGNRPWRDQNR